MISDRERDHPAADKNESQAAGPQKILARQENTVAGANPTPAVSTSRPAKGGLSLEDFILLNEEIAGMARAGLPLDQGLSALAGEMGNGKLRRVTAQMAEDLKAGLTLPQAIERQAGRLPAYYAKLLAAGIRSGRIGDVISTMTVYARTLVDLRNTVLSALCYPCVVLVLSLIVFGVLNIYLVPQLKDLYNQVSIPIGMRKPLLTEIAFFLLDHALWIFIVVPLALIGTVLGLLFVARQSPAGRTALARFWYAVPIVGPLLRSAHLAAFADLLGVLVDNDVPLPEAFLLAGHSSSDPLLAAGAERVHDGLCQGMPLGAVLREQRLVPEVLCWMVALGEKRGTLGPTLHEAGAMYRRQVEVRASLLHSVLPPFVVIALAGVQVILFIFALLVPIVDLVSNLGGGLGVFVK